LKTIAFIFARGGSKGLPGKNIRLLGGKPLIAWSIEHALSVNRIERVLVSTDSEEIAEVARKYGAEVPFIRPDELARDNTPEWHAWRHALSYLLKKDGVIPEIMVSVPTTAPLRLPLDIENCLDEYERTNSDIIITVTDAHRSPHFNMIKIQEDGTSELVIQPQSSVVRRQDAPEVFDITTVAYVVRSEFVMSHEGAFEGNVRHVHVPPERSIDIDTLLDFKIAEYLIQSR
jgi:CMP-N-acetylneuraminic acid synthetase